VTARTFATIRATVRALRAQTIASDIELLIVAPSAEAVDDARPWELEGFARVEVVPVGPIASVDDASATGILRASAPVVVAVEDHVYPEPEWAREILRAHEGPWDVVGGRLVNVNPGPLSWAGILIAHLPEVLTPAGESRGPITTHNASYKREVVQAYGDRLTLMMGRDGGLMRDLLRRGHRIGVHPQARYGHLQVTAWRRQPRYRFCSGRNAAATRARQGGWGPGRRSLYVLCTPLIPFVLLVRLIPVLRPLGIPSAALGPLALGLLIHSVGEAAGYALGPGGSREILANLEIDRRRFLSGRDRRRLDAMLT
jgi:hypothetical protein